MRKLNFVVIVILACAAYANQAMGQTSISTAGMIESQSGGIKFPDGTVQSSAADDDLSIRVAELESMVAELQGLLYGVSREIDPNTDQDTILFEDMNVQIVDGTGATDDVPTGTGNLIIGYNELRDHEDAVNDRTGSHMLVIGQYNNYSSFGGMVAGVVNTVSGVWSSVGGRQYNVASGGLSSISGGFNNTADGFAASVSGGNANRASAEFSSVSGGESNVASGDWASVSGGKENTASGFWSSVSGGSWHEASGNYSSVSGGEHNEASGDWASVSGGGSNKAIGTGASVSGGGNHEAGGNYSSVSGGQVNTASQSYSSVSGGLDNTASGYHSSVSGGNSKTAATDFCIVGDNGVDC